jgi:hypothetical protein
MPVPTNPVCATAHLVDVNDIREELQFLFLAVELLVTFTFMFGKTRDFLTRPFGQPRLSPRIRLYHYPVG